MRACVQELTRAPPSVVLGSRKWPLFDKWLAFLESQETKAVNQGEHALHRAAPL